MKELLMKVILFIVCLIVVTFLDVKTIGIGILVFAILTLFKK